MSPCCLSLAASNSVLADIRAVWGRNIRVIQTIEEGNQRLPGVDDVIFIQKAAWGETCSYWLLGACCALLAAVARSSRHPVQKASH